jgi:hypothetical protein
MVHRILTVHHMHHIQHSFSFLLFLSFFFVVPDATQFFSLRRIFFDDTLSIHERFLRLILGRIRGPEEGGPGRGGRKLKRGLAEAIVQSHINFLGLGLESREETSGRRFKENWNSVVGDSGVLALFASSANIRVVDRVACGAQGTTRHVAQRRTAYNYLYCDSNPRGTSSTNEARKEGGGMKEGSKNWGLRPLLNWTLESSYGSTAYSSHARRYHHTSRSNLISPLQGYASRSHSTFIGARLYLVPFCLSSRKAA